MQKKILKINEVTFKTLLFGTKTGNVLDISRAALCFCILSFIQSDLKRVVLNFITLFTPLELVYSGLRFVSDQSGVKRL